MLSDTNVILVTIMMVQILLGITFVVICLDHLEVVDNQEEILQKLNDPIYQHCRVRVQIKD